MKKYSSGSLVISLSRSLTVGVIVFSFSIASAYAANFYWVGAVNNSDRWEDANSWSTSPKGATGAGIPGASDTAIFNYSGTTVTIRSAVSVGGLELNDAWTGSILLGTGSLYVGSTGIRIGSGRLVGGTAAVATSGNYTQTGGIVSGLQGTFTLSGSVSITGASTSFTSTGTVVFDGATQTSTVGTTATASFTNITIGSSTSTTLSSAHALTGILQVNTGSTLAIGSNTLTATGATIVNYATINEGTGKISHTATSTIVSDSTFGAEQASFPIGSTVYFSLTEQDENISGTAADTVSVTVTLGNGDSESVTLTETNNTSGQFTGSIPTAQISPTASNGTLEADNSQVITITFTDAQDALSSNDTADLAVTAAPSTSTGSGRGAGGKATRLALIRARQSAAKPAAPESDEPVIKVDYRNTKVQPRAVKRETVDTPSEEVTRLQNRLQRHTSAPGSTNAISTRATPVRERVSENFEIRVCARVMRWFKDDGKMLGRVNRRLEGRFGFSCEQ